MGLACHALENGDTEGASAYLESALASYPENLGEGKLYGTPENDIYYLLGRTWEKSDYIKASEYYTLAMSGGNDLSSAMYYNDRPPEMFFYQAMASRAAGDNVTAAKKFNKLISYGLEHMSDHKEIEYFAVSLPDFLIFEGDLDKKNRVHCAFLAALGYSGKGDTDTALHYTEKGLAEDCSHQGLIALKKYLERI